LAVRFSPTGWLAAGSTGRRRDRGRGRRGSRASPCRRHRSALSPDLGRRCPSPDFGHVKDGGRGKHGHGKEGGLRARPPEGSTKRARTPEGSTRRGHDWRRSSERGGRGRRAGADLERQAGGWRTGGGPPRRWRAAG